jgi:hypothetical protein
MKYMNKKQTTFDSFGINCDQNLSKSQKIIWLILNYFNNITFKKLKDNSLYQIYFNSKATDDVSENIVNRGLTPARLLSDLFWEQVDYNLLANALNNKLNILEVGCGSGKYRDAIRLKYPDLIYTGVDIKKNSHWEDMEDSQTKFYQKSYLDIKDVTALNLPNVIFTQSALEHFEEDLTFFGIVKQISLREPLVFINVFPSASCLKTHLNHGIRNYNSRTIAKLLKNLDSDFNALIPLGSREFNRIHFKYITLPTLLFKKDKSKSKYLEYSQDLLRVYKRNMYDTDRPTFYCLISIFNLEIQKVDIEKIFRIRSINHYQNDSFFQ